MVQEFYELIPTFTDSILSAKDNFKEIGEDMVEATIDTIIENPIIDSIPFIRLGKGLLKIGFSLRDRNMLKNTLVFLQQFNSRQISDDKLLKYKDKYQNNKETQQEIQRVMLLLDRQLHEIKSKILANFFADYLESTISWDDFITLSEILDALNFRDIKTLQALASGEEKYNKERFITYGLIDMHITSFQDTIMSEPSIKMIGNDLMEKFISSGFLNI